MNLWLVFLTGLTTGGLSCLAMQGGLLASVMANQKEASDKHHGWWAVAMFLSAKLVIHTILGFLLGLLGSVLSLSLPVRLLFQVLAAGFMLATALNLLQVHPIFRYVVLQPPKFLQRWVRGSSKSSALFAPAVLGLLTVFIPCGITQAMEVVAITSGSPLTGAATMAAFVLGTSPLFAGIGIATARLSEYWHGWFTKVTAYALIVMAIYGLNGVLVVMNAPITMQKILRPVTYFFSEERFERAAAVATENGVQKVTIQVLNSGYSPRSVKVKAGVPVELTLESHETYTCAVAFMLPEFGIDTFLNATDRQTFTFTPQKKGRFTYTCSMGMYTGTLEVI